MAIAAAVREPTERVVSMTCRISSDQLLLENGTDRTG
jgi:hypothetical protein